MRSTPHWTGDARNMLGAVAGAYRVGVRSALAAWPILLGRAIFYGVCLMVLIAFWDKVGSERLAGSFRSRLPPGGLGVYIGVTEWITLSITTAHQKLEDDIRSGALEPHLLRPKPYLALTLAGEAGGMTARLVLVGAAGLVLLAMSGHAWPSGFGLAYIGVLGAIGAGIGVLINAVIGLTAFWLRRVLPPWLISQKLMFLMGGLFAPISLYPGWLHRIAIASPYAAVLAFAGGETLAPSAASFWAALGAQAFWAIGLALVLGAVWRAGLRKSLRAGV
jgi:ABC-2 type transport system permease protein